MDAVLVTIALRQQATILTGDPDDIKRLGRASGRTVAVVAAEGLRECSVGYPRPAHRHAEVRIGHEQRSISFNILLFIISILIDITLHCESLAVFVLVNDPVDANANVDLQSLRSWLR